MRLTQKKIDAADYVKTYYPGIKYKGTIDHTNLINKLDAEIGDAYTFDDDYMPNEIYDNVILRGDLAVSKGQPAQWYGLKNPLNIGFNSPGRCKTYDVCIIGGGAGGIAAAYALKDSGLKVCLIERLDSLGGTHCNGGVIEMLPSPAPDFLKPIIGYLQNNPPSVGVGFLNWSRSSYPVGGDSETEFDKLWRGGEINYGTAISNWGNSYLVNPYYLQEKYYNDLKDKIDVFLHHEFVASEVFDGQVTCIVINDTAGSGATKIFADYFIDATANIDLVRYGTTEGTDYHIGSDTRVMYNEPAIYENTQADKYSINTMGPTYLVSKIDDNPYVWSLPVAKPDSNVNSGARNAEWEIPPRYSLASSIATGYWFKNDLYSKGFRHRIIDPDKYADVTSHDYIDGGYDYAIQKGRNNAALHFRLLFPDGDNIFHGSMPLLAIRESYRANCEHMLCQSDIETLATSSNIGSNHYIALSSWWVDIHDEEGIDLSDIAYRQIFGIPYESIIPTAFKNVLVACRGFGASHLAASAARLTKTVMCIGYAAGKAAILARSNGLDDFRDVPVSTLQTNCGVLAKIEDLETYFELN